MLTLDKKTKNIAEGRKASGVRKKMPPSFAEGLDPDRSCIYHTLAVLLFSKTKQLLFLMAEMNKANKLDSNAVRK